MNDGEASVGIPIKAAPPYFLCYVITNTVNGKIYVGITTRSLKRRFAHHFFRARHGYKTRLYTAIRKYGEEHFVIELAASANSWSELLAVEQAMIADRDAMHPNIGYNMTGGGEGTLHWTPGSEWRAKQSLLQTGKSQSPERRAKASASLTGSGNPRFGVTLTPETRRRISEALIGKAYPSFSEHHRCGIGEAVKAARRNPDHPLAHVVSFQGQRRVLSEWAECLGIPRGTLDRRIRVYGWSIEEAFTRPVRSRRSPLASNDEGVRDVA